MFEQLFLKMEVKYKENGSDKMFDGLKLQLHTCKHLQIAKPIQIISKCWLNYFIFLIFIHANIGK